MSTRILATHDIPTLLVHLVEFPPWKKRKSGDLNTAIANYLDYDIRQGV